MIYKIHNFSGSQISSHGQCNFLNECNVRLYEESSGTLCMYTFQTTKYKFRQTNKLAVVYIYKTKNLSVEKERSIDSKAQKKTNKITKFRINAFL